MQKPLLECGTRLRRLGDDLWREVALLVVLAKDFGGNALTLLTDVLLVGLDLVDNIVIVVFRALGVLDILAKDFLVILDLLLKIFHLVQLVVGDRLDVFVAEALL